MVLSTKKHDLLNQNIKNELQFLKYNTRWHLNMYASSCNKSIVHPANDVILRASYRHLHVHSIDCEARRYVLNVKESCRVCTCQKGKIYTIRMSLSAIVGGNYKWIYLQKWIVSVIWCIYVSYIGYTPLYKCNKTNNGIIYMYGP